MALHDIANRRHAEKALEAGVDGVIAVAVAVLEGCAMPELYGRVNRAQVRVLAAAGL